MIMETKEKYYWLKGLKSLKSKVTKIDPSTSCKDNPYMKHVYSNHGICTALYKELDILGHSQNVSIQLGEIAENWEHFSGDWLHPVQSSNKEQNAEEFYDSHHSGLWEGKQLMYRLSLIDYLIKELEEENGTF